MGQSGLELDRELVWGSSGGDSLDADDDLVLRSVPADYMFP